MKKTNYLIASVVMVLVAAATVVHAQSTTTAALGVSTSSSGVQTTVAAKGQSRLPTLISKGDSAITARIAALNALNTRIAAMKNVSADEKSTFSSTITTNINGLTTLKAKIDADTDLTTAKTDVQSIFGSFRIYALIIPQGYIAAAADRVTTIGAMMTSISTKLQTRITADQSAGKDVSAMQTALSDLNAKVSDASTQASTAQSSVASLVPDQGNKTQLAANTTALKAARADIKTATSDLQAARTDAKTIMQDLKSLEGSSASASASASTQ